MTECDKEGCDEAARRERRHIESGEWYVYCDAHDPLQSEYDWAFDKGGDA